jgi:hypothetical protein
LANALIWDANLEERRGPQIFMIDYDFSRWKY